MAALTPDRWRWWDFFVYKGERAPFPNNMRLGLTMLTVMIPGKTSFRRVEHALCVHRQPTVYRRAVLSSTLSFIAMQMMLQVYN